MDTIGRKGWTAGAVITGVLWVQPAFARMSAYKGGWYDDDKLGVSEVGAWVCVALFTLFAAYCIVMQFRDGNYGEAAKIAGLYAGIAIAAWALTSVWPWG